MYKLTVKDSVYTIPKKNLKFLAMIKAKDYGKNPDLSTEEKIIEFFKSISIFVEKV
jgi:hypothetical protein